MATRYYGSELRPNSGKRILGPGAQASQCPFATSANNTPYGGAGSPAVARSPGPMQHRPSSSRVPWAVDADRSGGRNTQGYIVPAKCATLHPLGPVDSANDGRWGAQPFSRASLVPRSSKRRVFDQPPLAPPRMLLATSGAATDGLEVTYRSRVRE